MLARISVIFFSLCLFNLAFANSEDGESISTRKLSEDISTTGQSNYRFSALHHSELDKIGVIQTIVQDRQGLMWFGGSKGLARYDGYEIKLYFRNENIPHSISNNDIRKLLVDSQGRLWVATIWKLNLYDPNVDGFKIYQRDRRVDLGRSIEEAIENYQPITIPGRIEAENPSAYRDRTPFNLGDKGCANFAFDVEKTFDKGGGCNIAWTQENEWLEYAVNVEHTGVYDINIRAASSFDDHVVHLEVDDIDISGPINIKQEGWQAFHDHIVPVELAAGIRRIRLVFEAGGANVNYLEVKPSQSEPVSEQKLRQIRTSQDQLHKLPLHNLSYDSTSSLVFDSQGRLWIGTARGLTRFSFDGKTDRYFLHNPNVSQTVTSDNVTALLEDREGRLWIGHRYHGVDLYDPKTDGFSNFRYDKSNIKSLDANLVTKIFEDSEGDVWVGTAGGINRFNSRVKGFERFTSDDVSGLVGVGILGIAEDRDQNLWVATNSGGLNLFDRKTKTFIHYKIGEDDLITQKKGKVTALYKSEDGRLWLGHYLGGVSFLDEYASAFVNYKHNHYDANSLSHNDIKAVAEDKRGNYWIGTTNGLNYLDAKNKKVERYYSDTANNHSLFSNNIEALLVDRDGDLWVGSQNGGLSKLEEADNKFVNFEGPENSPYGNNNKRGYVKTLFQDSSDDIWIGLPDGITVTSPNKYDFEFIGQRYAFHLGRGIYKFYEDSLGEFWVTSTDGLFQMGRKEKTFKYYRQIEGDNTSFAGGTIFSIEEDSNKDLWLAHTYGVSRFNRQSQNFKNYSIHDGMPETDISCLARDTQGIFWLGSATGIIRFDVKLGSFKKYTTEYGLPGDRFNNSACLLASSGVMVFGSKEGLTVFNPLNIFKNLDAPPVVITDLQILNKSVSHNQADSPLHLPINYTKKISLNHEQSVFSFEFAALNYRIPKQNRYAYKLEGFDKQWNYVGGRRLATYTNIDPGHYIFRVKASNNEGVWHTEGTTINIQILPPWWRTWWAYSIYSLLILLIILQVAYSIWQKKRAEDEAKLNQQLQVVDKLKDDFLANTSHELRTPLNGIIGLSESLIDGAAGPVSELMQDNLKMIVNSGRRLSCLVNDVLDFSKLREHTIKLNRQPVDLRSMASVVLQLSKPLVGSKLIRLVNEVEEELPMVFADENRLQQILYNLIGNAIKFSTEGEVRVKSVLDDGQIWLEVCDEGIGIAEDKFDQVFRAFEQVGDESEGHYGGTGLGLAVTKQLVELHGGRLELESTLGKGSTFRFSLSLSDKTLSDQTDRENSRATDTDHFSPMTRAHDIPTYLSVDSDSANAPVVVDGKYHILIVDDELINRRVLVNLLSMHNYKTSECCDGLEALDYLSKENDIDLVLLDVMMPQISGYEVCKRLRHQYSVSQLPIIFLTAKNQVSDLEAGYEAGGSDFLGKPIAKEELLARVKTHVELHDITENLEDIVVERTDSLRLTNEALAESKEEIERSHEEIERSHKELEQSHQEIERSHKELERSHEEIERSHQELERSYSNLKRAQSQLVHAEKMSSLGLLVTGIGHEINNPSHYALISTGNLTELLANFETSIMEILEEDVEPEILNIFQTYFRESKGALEVIRDGMDRIQGIVKNLRSFSRSGDIEKKPTQLRRHLEATVNLVKPKYKSLVAIKTDYRDDPPVNCSPSELNQVFMNLIVNACQAIVGESSENDHLNSALGELNISMVAKDDELVVAFEDNGCGMGEETISRIFDPFYTTKGEDSGTGLGMSIAYGIVEKHAGRIEVESEEGKGSHIAVHLPLFSEDDVNDESAQLD